MDSSGRNSGRRRNAANGKTTPTVPGLNDSGNARATSPRNALDFLSDRNSNNGGGLGRAPSMRGSGRRDLKELHKQAAALQQQAARGPGAGPGADSHRANGSVSPQPMTPIVPSRGVSRGSEMDQTGSLGHGQSKWTAKAAGTHPQLRPSQMYPSGTQNQPASRGGWQGAVSPGSNRRHEPSTTGYDMPPLHPMPAMNQGRRDLQLSPAASRDFDDEMDRFMGASSTRTQQASSSPDDPASFRSSQLYVAQVPQGSRFGSESRPVSREAHSQMHSKGSGIKPMDSMGFAYHNFGSSLAAPKGKRNP